MGLYLWPPGVGAKSLLTRTIGGVTGLAISDACCCEEESTCDCSEYADTLYMRMTVNPIYGSGSADVILPRVTPTCDFTSCEWRAPDPFYCGIFYCAFQTVNCSWGGGTYNLWIAGLGIGTIWDGPGCAAQPLVLSGCGGFFCCEVRDVPFSAW